MQRPYLVEEGQHGREHVFGTEAAGFDITAQESHKEVRPDRCDYAGIFTGYRGFCAATSRTTAAATARNRVANVGVIPDGT